MNWETNTGRQELQHYGVKGMKWGVRKADYKAMTRGQRKTTKKTYKREKRDEKARNIINKHGSAGKAHTIEAIKSVGKTAGSVVLSQIGTYTAGQLAPALLYLGNSAAAGLIAGPIGMAAAVGGAYGAVRSVYKGVQRQIDIGRNDKR